MSREVLTRFGRIGVFLAALALCAGVGWQVGRAAAPGVPDAAPEVSYGHHH